jgi:DNA-binding CsgD family transcriptional regulator
MPLGDEPAWPRLVTEVETFLKETAVLPKPRGTLALDDLTPRERNVLEGIACGLDNKEIAASLGLSEKTIRNHITRVFDKIQVQHRYEAIVRARDAGLGSRPAARSRGTVVPPCSLKKLQVRDFRLKTGETPILMVRLRARFAPSSTRGDRDA